MRLLVLNSASTRFHGPAWRPGPAHGQPRKNYAKLMRRDRRTMLLGTRVPRQISFVTSCRARVGRVTPCAPRSANSFPNGVHGVTRPTTSRNLFVTVLVGVVVACAGFGQEAKPAGTLSELQKRLSE